MHVGPIVAKKYDIHLVAYDGYGNKNMVNKKTHIFTKSCNEPEIIYELKSYWHEPLKNRAIHIVGDGHIHFRYFQPSEKRRTPRNSESNTT